MVFSLGKRVLNKLSHIEITPLLLLYAFSHFYQICRSWLFKASPQNLQLLVSRFCCFSNMSDTSVEAGSTMFIHFCKSKSVHLNRLYAGLWSIPAVIKSSGLQRHTSARLVAFVTMILFAVVSSVDRLRAHYKLLLFVKHGWSQTVWQPPETSPVNTSCHL